jgi:hypothetical protein
MQFFGRQPYALSRLQIAVPAQGRAPAVPICIS